MTALSLYRLLMYSIVYVFTGIEHVQRVQHALISYLRKWATLSQIIKNSATHRLLQGVQIAPSAFAGPFYWSTTVITVHHVFICTDG